MRPIGEIVSIIIFLVSVLMGGGCKGRGSELYEPEYVSIIVEQDAGLSVAASVVIDGVEIAWDVLNQNIRVLNNNDVRASVRFRADTYELRPHQPYVIQEDYALIKAGYRYNVSVQVDQHELVWRTFHLIP